MNTDIERIQLIFRFFADELSPRERYHFETRLLLDPGFADEVEFQKIMLEGFKLHDEEREYEALIKEVLVEVNQIGINYKKTTSKTYNFLLGVISLFIYSIISMAAHPGDVTTSSVIEPSKKRHKITNPYPSHPECASLLCNISAP